MDQNSHPNDMVENPCDRLANFTNKLSRSPCIFYFVYWHNIFACFLHLLTHIATSTYFANGIFTFLHALTWHTCIVSKHSHSHALAHSLMHMESTFTCVHCVSICTFTWHIDKLANKLTYLHAFHICTCIRLHLHYSCTICKHVSLITSSWLIHLANLVKWHDLVISYQVVTQSMQHAYALGMWFDDISIELYRSITLRCINYSRNLCNPRSMTFYIFPL